MKWIGLWLAWLVPFGHHCHGLRVPPSWWQLESDLSSRKRSRHPTSLLTTQPQFDGSIVIRVFFCPTSVLRREFCVLGALLPLFLEQAAPKSNPMLMLQWQQWPTMPMTVPTGLRKTTPRVWPTQIPASTTSDQSWRKGLFCLLPRP